MVKSVVGGGRGSLVEAEIGSRIMWINSQYQTQWNLSIADMLYSGHLSIADTSSRSQLFHATVKLLHFEPLSSGHLSIADTFFENRWCPLLRGFTILLAILWLTFLISLMLDKGEKKGNVSRKLLV